MILLANHGSHTIKLCLSVVESFPPNPLPFTANLTHLSVAPPTAPIPSQLQGKSAVKNILVSQEDIEYMGSTQQTV
jgi:hypothetical protein